MAGQFIDGDKMYDNKNHMIYTYCENRATHEFGFDGILNKEKIEQLQIKDIDITIPKDILNSRVHSIEDAFKDTKHLNINLTINANDINITDAFQESGITHIPDFKGIEAKIIDTEFFGGPDMDGSWWYESFNVSGDVMYDIIVNSKNIPLQEKVDFMLENYNLLDDKRLSIPEKNRLYSFQTASKRLAEKYFGLPINQPFITDVDLKKIQKMADLLQSDDKTKLTHLAQIITQQKEISGKFEDKIIQEILYNLNISSLKMDKILPKYLENVNIDDISISSVNIVNKDKKVEQIYLIITEDKIATIYNPMQNTFDYAGKVINLSSIQLSDAYMNCDFQHTQRTEYEDILNDIKFKNSELAKDVLESDNISVPETNIEEKEQEI